MTEDIQMLGPGLTNSKKVKRAVGEKATNPFVVLPEYFWKPGKGQRCPPRLATTRCPECGHLAAIPKGEPYCYECKSIKREV